MKRPAPSPRLAYLYLDQTPLTISAAYRADIKRPDFLVAVDGLGTIALDAKAKNIIDGCFVLDASERRRLDGFESAFGIPVWYACFPPAEPAVCHLFRNRALIGSAVMHDAAKQIIRAPLALGFAVEHGRAPFAHALRHAVARAVHIASQVLMRSALKQGFAHPAKMPQVGRSQRMLTSGAKRRFWVARREGPYMADARH